MFGLICEVKKMFKDFKIGNGKKMFSEAVSYLNHPALTDPVIKKAIQQLVTEKSIARKVLNVDTEIDGDTTKYATIQDMEMATIDNLIVDLDEPITDLISAKMRLIYKQVEIDPSIAVKPRLNVLQKYIELCILSVIKRENFMAINGIRTASGINTFSASVPWDQGGTPWEDIGRAKWEIAKDIGDQPDLCILTSEKYEQFIDKVKEYDYPSVMQKLRGLEFIIYDGSATKGGTPLLDSTVLVIKRGCGWNAIFKEIEVERYEVGREMVKGIGAYSWEDFKITAPLWICAITDV